MRSHTALTPAFVAAAATIVRRHTGLVFSEARRRTLEQGLVTAMARAKPAAPDDYLARLGQEPALLDDLVGEITVGETYFFRDPRQLDLVRDVLLPDLARHRPWTQPLRLWSAGCATGEEPYTLAMILHELELPCPARLLGTDLSRRALATACHGRYGPWSLRGVPEQVVSTHFERVGNVFHLTPAVRQAVEFQYGNLVEDAYPSLAAGIWGMDLILCRNVLIYFDADTVARVAGRLMEALSEEGWLLLGASDPVLQDLVPCEAVITPAGLAYRRARRGLLRRLAPALAPAPPGPASAGPLAAEPLLAAGPPPSPVAAPADDPLPGSTPSEVPTLADVADSYAAREYARAAELAARMIHRDGSDAAPWILLVRSLANQGELDAAGRACAAGLDHHRTSAELAYLHAVLLAEAGTHAEAAAAARRAIYLDRRMVVAHLTLGGALARLGETGGACRAFANAQRLLAGMPPDAVVPASDGERAGRLVQMAGSQLRLLQGAAA